jgi:hypothetical protein
MYIRRLKQGKKRSVTITNERSKIRLRLPVGPILFLLTLIIIALTSGRAITRKMRYGITRTTLDTTETWRSVAILSITINDLF